MDIDLLKHKPHFITQIANWYHNEWGVINPDPELNNQTIATLEVKLAEYCNSDRLPLMLVATCDTELIAAAQIRFQENTNYPADSHWLGGVYVCKSQRGNGTAQSLIEVISEKAKLLGVQELYLHTEVLSGGLYKKMGWLPVEEILYCGINALIMKKRLNE
ncbi:GNAT family N-acetyltransferase [Shewanella sp. VB17]|uniref:GNAT family N-acetyltransferase n=1 Tax=Shewanella sp. VB17 TaxID=2739432 RepID=UPI00156626F5|nr:GNAT family N-acetyltransferase [Shewanella sp. VB17]NRD71892.1 GNAT family N-acetyltransferase [Shewanella sp. VB17]